MKIASAGGPAPAQATATQPKGKRKGGYRQSLLAGGEEGAGKLAERTELVRGPAIEALEALLLVGFDEQTGERNAKGWAMGEDERRTVEAFERAFSPLFSSIPALKPLHPF